MSIRFPLKHRVGLFSSNLLAALGLDRRAWIRLSEVGDMILCEFPDGRMYVPSAVRWRFYKRGLKSRFAKLKFQFGVGDHIDVKPGDTVLEVGANVGEFSLAMAEMGADVVAVDGDPLVFRCLAENTKGVSKIRIIEKVIWKEETELVFYSEPNEADSSVFRPLAQNYQSKELRVQATTLDKLSSALNLEQIDLLKCDAEGAEPEVIEGGREILGRTRQAVFDTGAERMGEETSEEVQRALESLGFRVFHDRRPNRKMTFGIRD